MILSTLYQANGDIKNTLQMTLASTFSMRLKGLLGCSQLEKGTGLLLTDCTSVHTCLMKFPIDLIYLDSRGIIVELKEYLASWKFHWSKQSNAQHTLEVPAGTIQQMSIQVGDQIKNAYFGLQSLDSRKWSTLTYSANYKQRGSSMIEFAIAMPIITLMGLAILQYALLFFTKNHINHAIFMAARLGSTENANVIKIQEAYARALIPLYTSGQTESALTKAYLQAKAEVTQFSQIERLNPTAQSFADWNDTALQQKLKLTTRVISNHGLPYKELTKVKSTSQQNIYDANILKIQITHGYRPQIPLIRNLYIQALKLFDKGDNPFYSYLINAGRIPIISHVSIHMQSDAIESDSITPMPIITKAPTSTPPSPLSSQEPPNIPESEISPSPNTSESTPTQSFIPSENTPANSGTSEAGACNII